MIYNKHIHLWPTSNERRLKERMQRRKNWPGKLFCSTRKCSSWPSLPSGVGWSSSAKPENLKGIRHLRAFHGKIPNGALRMESNSVTCDEEFFMLHTSMLLPLIEKKNWNSSSGEDTSSRWLPSCSTSIPPTSGIASLSCWPSSSSVGSKYPSHACNTKKWFPTSTNPKTHLTIQILSFLATMNTLRWEILLQQSEFPTLQPWRPLFAYSNTHPGTRSKELSAAESAFSSVKASSLLTDLKTMELLQN